jgi:hypothetical protein
MAVNGAFGGYAPCSLMSRSTMRELIPQSDTRRRQTLISKMSKRNTARAGVIFPSRADVGPLENNAACGDFG